MSSLSNTAARTSAMIAAAKAKARDAAKGGRDSTAPTVPTTNSSIPTPAVKRKTNKTKEETNNATASASTPTPSTSTSTTSVTSQSAATPNPSQLKSRKELVRKRLEAAASPSSEAIDATTFPADAIRSSSSPPVVSSWPVLRSSDLVEDFHSLGLKPSHPPSLGLPLFPSTSSNILANWLHASNRIDHAIQPMREQSRIMENMRIEMEEAIQMAQQYEKERSQHIHKQTASTQNSAVAV